MPPSKRAFHSLQFYHNKTAPIKCGAHVSRSILMYTTHSFLGSKTTAVARHDITFGRNTTTTQKINVRQCQNIICLSVLSSGVPSELLPWPLVAIFGPLWLFNRATLATHYNEACGKRNRRKILSKCKINESEAVKHDCWLVSDWYWLKEFEAQAGSRWP